MACDDIVGSGWIAGLLVVDSTDEVIIDPKMDTTKTGATFFGKFQATGEQQFTITCQELGGGRSRISFTRTHPGGLITTHYTGIVIRFGSRAQIGVIRGRFRRETFVENAPKLVVNGDWETERPT